MRGRVNGMDNGQKKIWICLLIVVLAAVVIGILYYFSTPAEHSSEGFLIRAAHERYETTNQAETPDESCRGVVFLTKEVNCDGI